ncbi:MAG: AAA family ATPase [Chloroflexota bacterium]|nr:AAA family ATPase [Chloroflexota bacterium]
MVVQEVHERLLGEWRKVLVGQEQALELLYIALLVGGHVLIEGVPGTAKTLMAKTLARLVQGEFKRVQFTPDLMPSDVIGTTVFDLQPGKFHLKQGPVFTNVLLADEVNRAPAKTQSALLEAMEERQVTIEGASRKLPDLFITLATENPIEYEGTYPLPEAQLDRFLFKLSIPYMPQEQETELLMRYHRGFDARNLDAAGLHPVVDEPTLRECVREVAQVTVEPSIATYITSITRASRRSPDLSLDFAD